MNDERQIRTILEAFARNTRQDNKDAILANHTADLLIYDVIPPMKYESAVAYRASWDDWQPETTGESIFEFQDLVITAGSDVAFAHAFIRCGGATPTGKTFEDIVRATFCLKKIDGAWKVAHQHVSKPLNR
jgi:ketosteroid isomerase-like protein